jgi:CheY-like chemotaxis protein
MDVQMPEMDGYETTAAIRAREALTGAHVPIIAMTAYAMKGDRERCLEAGMDAYVSKPIRARELYETLESMVPRSAGDRPASAEAAPPADGPNWSAALSHVGGDRELLRELVSLFLAECPRWMADLRQAIASGDSTRLKIAAHTLKSPMGHFAAGAAFDTAQKLEVMGREGNLTGANEALVELEREVKRLEPALVAFVHQTP